MFSQTKNRYVATIVEVASTETTEAKTSTMARVDYKSLEKFAYSNDAKVLHAILLGLKDGKTNSISSCPSAYVSWNL